MKNILTRFHASALLVAFASCVSWSPGFGLSAEPSQCPPTMKRLGGGHGSAQDEALKKLAEKLGQDEEDLYFLGRCQKAGAMGFDFEHTKATAALPTSTTDDPNECVIYVTRKVSPKGNIYVYAQSNLKHTGAEYPTKATFKAADATDLLDIANNIITEVEEPTDEDIAKLRKRPHKNNLNKFYLRGDSV